MKCPYCGTEIAASDAAFCPECGQRLSAAPSVPPKISRSERARPRAAADAVPRYHVWLIAVLSVLAVLLISLIALTVYFDLTAEDWSSLLRGGARTGAPALHEDRTAGDGAPAAEAGNGTEPTSPPQADGTEPTPPPQAEEGAAAQEPAASDTAGSEPEPDTMITLPGGTKAPITDFVFPYSSSQALTTTDLDAAFAGFDSASAALLSQQAINEIYARYGYRFHPELSVSAQWASQYFGALSWYNDIVQDSWSNTGEVPVNSTEAANIDLIVEWQRNHGYR